VLGCLFFLINDIDKCVVNRLLKFADDTKLFEVVANEEDMNTVQNDLKSLCSWFKEWLMIFNTDKCSSVYELQ
jgi:hypothetical protein